MDTDWSTIKDLPLKKKKTTFLSKNQRKKGYDRGNRLNLTMPVAKELKYVQVTNFSN